MSVLTHFCSFPIQVDATNGELRERRSSVPLLLKIFSLGGPFRAIGAIIGTFLAFVGALLNLVGFIGGSFGNGLGNGLGSLGHLIGIIANGIGSFGRSNFQFVDAIKAAF